MLGTWGLERFVRGSHHKTVWHVRFWLVAFGIGPTMQSGIHPQYHQTTISCSCGNSFLTGCTRKELRVDICSACHPFFTGKLKFLDTAGRIEKFQTKFAAGTYASVKKPTAKKKVVAKEEA